MGGSADILSAGNYAFDSQQPFDTCSTRRKLVRCSSLQSHPLNAANPEAIPVQTALVIRREFDLN